MNSNQFFDGRYELTKALDICAPPDGPMDWWGRSKYTQFDESWDDVFSVKDTSTLLAKHPFEPSDYRDGYKMWDFIMLNGKSNYRAEHDGKHKFTQQAFTRAVRDFKLNTHWDNIQNMMTMKGGIPYCLDLAARRDGRELLEIIHVMAHILRGEESFKSSWEGAHTQNAPNIIQAAAEIAVSHIFNLPIDFTFSNKTSRLPYGIYVSASAKTGYSQKAPLLQFPFKTNNMDICDKLFAVIHVMVEPGHDPIGSILPGHDPVPLVDWWAFQPKRMFILGWELLDVVSAMDVVAQDRSCVQLAKAEGAYAMHPSDLYPPSTFMHYLTAAADNLERPDGVMPHTWAETTGFMVSQLQTPFLPCNVCMLKNRQIDSTINIPMDRIPKDWKQSEEWSNYKRHLKYGLKFVEKAKKEYYHGDFIGERAARRRSFEQNQQRNRVLEKRRRQHL